MLNFYYDRVVDGIYIPNGIPENFVEYYSPNFNDISFKGNLNKIWGYKLGNYKKQMNYFRYDKDKDSFIHATDDEIKSIN